MKNTARIILLTFLVMPLAFSLGTGTQKAIDVIVNNTGTDIALNPNNKVTVFGLTSDTVLYYDSGITSVAAGVDGQILSQIAGVPTWADAPSASPLTTKGDLYTYDTDNQRLAVGVDGQVLGADSAEGTGLKWIDPPATSPTTTEGDLILRGASEDERLAIGTVDQIIISNGTTASWQDPPISLPTQTSEEGKFLITDGTDASWKDVNEGSYNYIKNGKFENNTTGWTPYCNTAAGVKPDDFGGVAAGLTLTKNTTTPLKELADLEIAKDAVNRQGCGVYYDFDITRGSFASIQRWMLDIDNSGSALDGDWRMYVMSSSDNFVADFNLIDVSSGAADVLAGKFEAYLKSFQTDASDTDYRVALHLATTSVLAYSTFIDDATFRKQIVANGPPVTGELPYTPSNTQGFGTITSNLKWSRTSDKLHISGTFTAGTVAGSEAQIELPDNLAIDSDKVNVLRSCGTYFFGGVASSTQGGPVLATGGDTYLNFSAADVFGSGSVDALAPANGNTVVLSTRQLTIDCTVPIQGWNSEQQSSEDVSGRFINVKGAGNGGGGFTANVTNIDFTEVKDLTGSWNGSEFIAPETGTYDLSGAIKFVAAVIQVGVVVYVDDNTGGGYVAGETIGFQRASTEISRSNFSGKVDLKSGDKLAIRLDVSGTLSGSAGIHHISISKVANPQQILDTATVAARYTSNSGQTVGTTETLLKFEDLEKDTHGKYDVTTGEYEIPMSGWYTPSASFKADTSNNTVTVYIKVDGTTEMEVRARSGSITTGLQPFASGSIYLVKDSIVTVYGKASSNSGAINTSPEVTYFSISRIK